MAQTTMYTQQPIVLQQHIMRYGPDPQLIQCPHCSSQVMTSVMTEAGAITWLASGLICLVGYVSYYDYIQSSVCRTINRKV